MRLRRSRRQPAAGGDAKPLSATAPYTHRHRQRSTKHAEMPTERRSMVTRSGHSVPATALPEPNRGYLENRQRPSRSFVGSNPTPPSPSTECAWLSADGPAPVSYHVSPTTTGRERSRTRPRRSRSRPRAGRGRRRQCCPSRSADYVAAEVTSGIRFTGGELVRANHQQVAALLAEYPSELPGALPPT